MLSELTYLVSCSGCYKNSVVAVKDPWRGHEVVVAEERRQLALDGWSTERDFVVCPDCVAALAPGIAV